ncbi:MAG: T9SS type A sorting domain-containing protein [Flavobacterium sp.]
MKKKLLIGLFALMGVMSSAQTKVWDFGNNTAIMPLLPTPFSGVPAGTEDIVDDLGRVAHESNSNFAAYASASATFSDGFVASIRANTGGNSNVVTNALPTMRFFFFDVSGNCTVKVWFRAQGTSSRIISISDGINVLASQTTTTQDPFILTGVNTGGAKRLYVYANNGFGIYKIEVTGANVSTTVSMQQFLSIDSVKLSEINYFVKDKTVYLNNIKSYTNLQVYSITGALVKSLNVVSDTSFELDQTGIYLIKAFSNEGQKTSKILIQ